MANVADPLNPHKDEEEILSGKRILIAEDDAQIRTIVANVLTRLKAIAVTAVDGVDGIEVLQNQQRKKEPFDLAMLDLMMPRMNGLGLLRYIRDNIHFNHLPVIIFSGADEERELHECRCLGIDDFIPKPLNMSNIIKAITNSIRSRHSKSQAVEYFEEEHKAILSSYGFPLEFGGFPMPKQYALRPSYFRCPFCETTFTAPRLTNRALKPDYNDRLAIGLYRDGLEKSYIEYPLTEMVICPECFYASDRIGFMRIWTKRPSNITQVQQIPAKEWEKVFFPVSAKIRKDMKIQEVKRHELVQKASGHGMGLFRLATTTEVYPREPEDALISLDLAVSCARSLQKYFMGEASSRLVHKSAGYLLKKFYIYGLMAKMPKYKDKIKTLKQMRIKTMFEAMQALIQVNDIDFNVLEERLYCITRRFFLSDMLLPFIASKDEKENMVKLRKKCVGEMKMALVKARQAKSPEVKTIERFLLPIENRYLDIAKEEKMAKMQAQMQQQRQQ